MSVYWCKKYVLKFRKDKLELNKGHLERTPKAISNENLFCRFQPWYWTVIQKMNSKDKSFLEKFSVREKSNLTGLEHFGATEFSIVGELGVALFLVVKKWLDLIPTHQSPYRPPLVFPHPPNFYLPMKALLSLLVLEMGH